jgi:hypothetical protein
LNCLQLSKYISKNNGFKSELQKKNAAGEESAAKSEAGTDKKDPAPEVKKAEEAVKKAEEAVKDEEKAKVTNGPGDDDLRLIFRSICWKPEYFHIEIYFSFTFGKKLVDGREV